MNHPFKDLTPTGIVAELDKDIVGQGKAKRAVAIAIRNRIRRQRLDEAMASNINPKNIILIGPTGVGKTEIARRLSKLLKAPFVKVEATKFTEVGYMGRDVESIIRDLTHNGIASVKREKGEFFAKEAARKTEERLLDALMFSGKLRSNADVPDFFSKVSRSFDLSTGDTLMKVKFEHDDADIDDAEIGDADIDDAEIGDADIDDADIDEADIDGVVVGDIFSTEGTDSCDDGTDERIRLRQRLIAGELENKEISLTVHDSGAPPIDMVALGPGSEEMEMQFRSVLKGIMPSRSRNKTFTVAEARPIIMKEETEKLLDMEKIIKEGIDRVEQRGIVFLDELDKVAMPVERKGSGPDVSREGVQRDLLPVVEGTTVMTKYGPVKTDHVLFIAAGAFHMSKPSDLIPELQGRFPIRVELEDLGVDELRRILTEPRSSLVKQYKALLSADGLDITFTDEALATIAKMVHRVNQESENLGARRLHTVLEKMLEELLFNAPDCLDSHVFEITSEYVESKLSGLVENRDLSRFIL
jgi:ATP-dependent HslUV protease ATP-binding subunit HslU